MSNPQVVLDEIINLVLPPALPPALPPYPTSRAHMTRRKGLIIAEHNFIMDKMDKLNKDAYKLKLQ
jgi:hypothetical protein